MSWDAKLAKPFFENGFRYFLSLFAIAVTTAYFVKESIMQSTNVLLLSAVVLGQNNSAWI